LSISAIYSVLYPILISTSRVSSPGNGALTAIGDAIWPRRLFCLTCDERSDGAYLCPDCAERLALERRTQESGSVRSAYSYQHIARQLVLKLKFGPVEEVMTRENLKEIYNVDFEILNVGGRPLTIYY